MKNTVARSTAPDCPVSLQGRIMQDILGFGKPVINCAVFGSKAADALSPLFGLSENRHGGQDNLESIVGDVNRIRLETLDV